MSAQDDAPSPAPDKPAVDFVEIARALAPYALVGACLWAVVTHDPNLIGHVVDLILGAALLAINPRRGNPNA